MTQTSLLCTSVQLVTFSDSVQNLFRDITASTSVLNIAAYALVTYRN